MTSLLKQVALCCCLALADHGLAQASEPLGEFMTDEGLLTVTRQQEFFDPYFAMKALWYLDQQGKKAAPDAVKSTAIKLMNRMLRYQDANGSFGRVCKHTVQGPWQVCQAADADDVSTALWVYCVFRFAPEDPVWDASAMKALTHLYNLWDDRRSVFRLFMDRPDALFIDNLELLGNLPIVQNNQALNRLNNLVTTEQDQKALRFFSQLKGRVLLNGIEQSFGIRMRDEVFPDSLSSPGRLPGIQFYPHIVAPLYIWQGPWQAKAVAQKNWSQWWHLVGSAWLKQETDPYPWAMVGLVASQLDKTAYTKWLSVACEHRKNPRWTVLDEAIWLRVGQPLTCEQ